MKMIFALAPLALGLAACQTALLSSQPGPAPYPDSPSNEGGYRAIGTEPFWELTIGRAMTFNDVGSATVVSEPTPRVRNGVAGKMYQGRRLSVNVVHAKCSDGMSERVYPDRVSVTVDGRRFDGCGAQSGFYARVGEDGRPR